MQDLADSKRINSNVKSVPNTATPLRRRRQLVSIDNLSATIVSQLFWPQLSQEEFNLPSDVSAMLVTYGAKYRSLKAPRKLEWKPNLGSVQLELTIGDQQLDVSVSYPFLASSPEHLLFPLRPTSFYDLTFSLQVSPFHAAVLMHFQSRPEWPAAELALEMGVAPDILRRKAIFWINQGKLYECG